MCRYFRVDSIVTQEGAGMNDTSTLLSRISAFRERLQNTPPLAQTVSTLPTIAGTILTAMPASSDQNFRPHELQTLPASESAKILPRVRQLLERSRDLVAAQKAISDDLFYRRLVTDPETATSGDALVTYHRHTVAATDSALRLTQNFPTAAEAQSRMCEGLETVIESLQVRLSLTTELLEHRRKEWGRIERISRLLCDLQARRFVGFSSVIELAQELLAEAHLGVPLKFHASPSRSVPRAVAVHALTTAEVVARLVVLDYEWNQQPAKAVAAALVMNVGMLTVPPESVFRDEDYRPEDWSMTEPHALSGAELIRSVWADQADLADAIAAHHERLDGTGYPRGLPAEKISSLARLLAVADTYAAAASDRPHRLAKDPRQALLEVLHEAEQGRLDPDFAEYLTSFSLYPIGTVVELSDGRIGIVVSLGKKPTGIKATSRPIVSLLTDSQQHVLARHEILDLSSVEMGGIVRALSSTERRTIFAQTHPELCG
jgi:hypothetical protein